MDLCLVLRRAKTQETVLWAGGVWDRLDRRFTEADPSSGQIIDLHEGQVEFCSWFAKWLQNYREGLPRETSLAIAGGDRRGGKTYSLALCTLAAAIDVPKTIGWLVSCAHSERDELDRILLETMFPSWGTYKEWPKHIHTLANGSSLLNISADDPETLKRGRVDIAFINEGQKMPQAVLTNLIGGTADGEGVALIAANPPQKSKGEWIHDLRSEILAGTCGEDAKYFSYEAKLNPYVSQRAKSRIGRILRLIDPAVAAADEDGTWKRPGEFAYEEFSVSQNVRPAPDLGDITFEFSRRRLGRGYHFLAGYDPNDRPHHVGVVAKIFGTISEPIVWVTEEIVVENADGEDHFLDRVEEEDFGIEDLAFVTDNSAIFQNSKHSQSGFVTADFFKKRGFRIEPNQPAAPGSKTGRPRNPDIELRVGLMNKLLHGTTERPPKLMVDPSCKALIEALKKCPSKKVRHGYGPVGRHSHITDALGYLCWWTFPRPKAKTSGSTPLCVFAPVR